MRQALLIIDVQNDYFPGGKFELDRAESALEQTLTLQRHFRKEQLPIFYVQHIQKRPDAPFFVQGSTGAEIHPRLLPIDQPHEYMVQKSFSNSFYQTDLPQKLQHEGVEQLVICGMMTHMCVDSTVRNAAERNFKPILIHDACATRNLSFMDVIIPAATVHNSFIAALMGFATVMGTHELIAD